MSVFEQNLLTLPFLAAKQGQAKTVVELLRAGAHPSAANDDKESPLALAAKNGHEDVLVSLLDAGVRQSTFRVHLLLQQIVHACTNLEMLSFLYTATKMCYASVR